ncbi:MAG: MBL fold metallo-hydrolase [Candidatus Thorarchaeota archaeon]|nr:MBL fold metallo-hydrolase [Candidatus Thorarchaeota archaeon]
MYLVELNDLTPRVVVARDREFFNVNAAGVALEKFIVVVDSFLFPIHSRQLREYVETKFNLPIKYVFLTHSDGDHVFGVDSFNGADIIASQYFGPKVKEFLLGKWSKKEFDAWKESEPEHADVIDEIIIHTPTIEFEKECFISDGSSKLELYHSGGHTSCSSWAYFPKDKVVFTGDDLASYDWPYISDFTGNPDNWISTFEHIMALDVDFIVPGHGVVVDKSHLKEHLDFIVTLRSLVKDAISEGKGKDNLDLPEFYPPAAEWQLERAFTHLFAFYSGR